MNEKTTALQALRWLMDDLHDSGEDRSEGGVIFDSCKAAYEVLERLEKPPPRSVQFTPPGWATTLEGIREKGRKAEARRTEKPPFDSVECEVKTGEDWLLTYWWWKHESWWLAEKLWRALVEPVVIEYLRNNDPEKADDPLYLDGVMAEFDFKGLDEKLIELLQFADEEQERNAGLTKEGEV